MRTYELTIPIAGVAYMTVEAESEEAAIEEAFNKISTEDIEEWEAFRAITRGNTLYAPLNEINVKDVTQEDD